MAQRRMFSKKIVETDYFMEMSPTAKLLYFYLNMGADDDGFVGNPRMIKVISGATDDDLKILIAKQFIIPFESGVIVIKDWRIHNYIQKDRYNKTQYTNEMSQLQIEENGMYTKRIQNVSSLDTQVRLGKDRLGEDRLGEDSKDILSGSDEPDSTRIQKSERDQMFETIWKLYPKKSGKANAKKDFDKAVKSGIDPELIKSKLEEYLKQIKAKQTPQQFIKQGSTWFHQCGWEDEYDFTPEARQTNGYGRQKREAVVPKFLKG